MQDGGKVPRDALVMAMPTPMAILPMVRRLRHGGKAPRYALVMAMPTPMAILPMARRRRCPHSRLACEARERRCGMRLRNGARQRVWGQGRTGDRR